MSQASDLARSAKEHASDLGTQTKTAVTQEAVAQADHARHVAADKVQQAADAADAAASELDPASPQAQAVQQVADRIEDVAMKLRGADLRQIAGQATDMARRNPLLFIGGAATAGFAAARFLKARDPRTAAWDINNDPWSSRRTNITSDGSVLSQINGERTHG